MSRHTLTSAERKEMPIDRGALVYFPDALLLVSMLSARANAKHAPGKPIQWVKGKSSDHGDCLVRHQLDVGEMDPEFNLNYAVHVAWRGLAQLQALVDEHGIEALFGPCPAEIDISHITGVRTDSRNTPPPGDENYAVPAEGFALDTLPPVEVYPEAAEPGKVVFTKGPPHLFTEEELRRTLTAQNSPFRYQDVDLEGPDVR